MPERFAFIHALEGAKASTLRAKYFTFEAFAGYWPKWKRQKTLSRLIKHKKIAIENAYFQCRNDDAGEAHDELIELEIELLVLKGFGKR